MKQPHEQKAFDLLIEHKDKIYNVLNIGIVNHPDKMHEIDTLVRLIQELGIKPNITNLEIWERNCRIGEKKYPDNKFINGDVRKIRELINDKFDFIFWWHGPEHIYENELVETISSVESCLTENGVIILGSPDGWQEQHNDDGNENNDHFSGPDTEFYRKLGYDVYRVWAPLWSLIAYKQV